MIGGHLPQAIGYVPFLHKLTSDFDLEDTGKLFTGLSFDPEFYSVDYLYNDEKNKRIVGMGAPRNINFDVILGKRHIFYSVSLTVSDICETQAFLIEFDVEF